MTTHTKKRRRDPVRSLAQSPSTDLDSSIATTSPETEKAKFALDPSLCGVTVVRSFDGKFGQQDITSLLLELDAQIQRLRGGDMSAVEAMLFAQATALQAIFVDLATRAQRQERLPVMQAQLTMALKAQAQCRATLEALAEVKNPRHPTFVRQQNVAQQQVVSNAGITCPHGHIEYQANKLITESRHAALDARGTGAAGNAGSELEAVAAFDGANIGRRKGAS